MQELALMFHWACTIRHHLHQWQAYTYQQLAKKQRQARQKAAVLTAWRSTSASRKAEAQQHCQQQVAACQSDRPGVQNLAAPDDGWAVQTAFQGWRAVVLHMAARREHLHQAALASAERAIQRGCHAASGSTVLSRPRTGDVTTGRLLQLRGMLGPHGSLAEHPGSLLGHPGSLLGHPGSLLGHPGSLLGHPDSLLGPQGSLAEHPSSRLGPQGSLAEHPRSLLGPQGSLAEHPSSRLGPQGSLAEHPRSLLGHQSGVHSPVEQQWEHSVTHTDGCVQRHTTMASGVEAAAATGHEAVVELTAAFFKAAAHWSEKLQAKVLHAWQELGRQAIAAVWQQHERKAAANQELLQVT
ncbi:hypothetical protein ABBQ38_011588 [Trebouxia sp. C0009 RCD-2024]